MTGTIATADRSRAPSLPRVGRFAPSPTGELHLGSLVAAVGSYLESRRQAGQWRLRIDDLDTARNVPGSADRILRTLDAFGFQWHGPVAFQSACLEAYRDALAELARTEQLFACACTRRMLSGAADAGCQQQCRSQHLPRQGHALRFALAPSGPSIDFDDALQGRQLCPRSAYPDVVVHRRDGVIAYQLAVVVDDQLAGITDVVRGADLLDSTPWQIGLQQALGLPTPRYAHLPLLLEADGSKLAKSRHAVPLDPAQAPRLLFHALELLRQEPPKSLIGGSLAALWRWAEDAWAPSRIAGLREVRMPELGNPGPL